MQKILNLSLSFSDQSDPRIEEHSELAGVYETSHMKSVKRAGRVTERFGRLVQWEKHMPRYDYYLLCVKGYKFQLVQVSLDDDIIKAIPVTFTQKQSRIW